VPRSTRRTHSGRSATRELLSPVFLSGVLLLIAAAIGLRPMMSALDQHYRKKSIDLRRRLVEFDATGLPSFYLAADPVARDVPLDDVGTEDLLFIRLEDRKARSGAAEAMLFVTYYSDPDDKVPHTPEVCYRQGGAVVEEMRTITLDTPELAPEHPRIDARFLRMSQRGGADKVIVVYVFHVNGEFRYDREQVRWLIAWPGDPYSYFSKVEAVVHYPPGADPAIAAERATRLLREALPSLLTRYYPETAIVKGLTPPAASGDEKRVDLRRPLTEFDVSRLPSFREHPLPKTISDDHIRADNYRLIGLAEKGQAGPDAQAALLVTYYNDPADPVPRISETCYRLGSAIARERTTAVLVTPDLKPERPDVRARVLNVPYTDPPVVIAYVFCVNGRFCCDYEQAQAIIDEDDGRHAYFSKVEVAVPYVLPIEDPAASPAQKQKEKSDPVVRQATARAEKLLSEALPILVSDHYPGD